MMTASVSCSLSLVSLFARRNFLHELDDVVQVGFSVEKVVLSSDVHQLARPVS
jgi:hypothetical protein